jgi:predicted HTH domain antitoxin
VAATRSAKNTTSGNDTPNTPGVSESAIARMKVGELRRELQSRGVKGTADLKKPELVKRLIKLETSGSKATRSAGKKSVSGRKNSTSGNDTPNTPEVRESAIAAMKVGELRRELQNRGVKGTADLKKPELVKKLIRLETAGAKSTRSTAKKSGSGRKNPTGGNDTPNTPEVSESAIAAMKVGELRRELQRRGVKGTADLKKPELVKKLIKLETSGSKSTRSTTKKSTSAATTRLAKKSASAATTPSPPKKSASVVTTTKVAPVATDRSTAKKLASATGKLPTTKKLLFAQTDLPSSDDIPTTLEVGENQGGRSRGKSGGGKRTTKAIFDSVQYSEEIRPVRYDLPGPPIVEPGKPPV